MEICRWTTGVFKERGDFRVEKQSVLKVEASIPAKISVAILPLSTASPSVVRMAATSFCGAFVVYLRNQTAQCGEHFNIITTNKLIRMHEKLRKLKHNVLI
jgi:hypothetical protein